ncbi:MAG: glycosyltransferase [Dehalococcoidia bacterium]|nr:glycosyltransferase [Dehalococcoidia bacterium]
MPFLAPYAEIDLFVDDYEPSDPLLKWSFPIRNYRDLPWRHAEGRYDAVLYQLGNSLVHRYQWPLIHRIPGFVVLHDLVLQHLVAGMAIDHRRPGEYLRAMAYAHPGGGLRMGWEVMTGQRSIPFTESPFCQSVVDVSLGVLVHSRFVERAVTALQPRAAVGYVPMGIPLPQWSAAKTSVRRGLGLHPDRFVVASLGEVTQHKRFAEVLAALRQLAAAGADFQYVVIGNTADFDIRPDIAGAGLTDRVRMTGRVDRATFEGYLQAADVCINLRYPTAGETSASALRSMAAGLAVIVSDIGANQELPEACCIKLPVGGDEVPLLAAALGWLKDHPETRSALGQNARAFVARRHTLEGAAAAYINFIQDVLHTPWRPPVEIEPMAHEPDVQYVRDLARELHGLGFRADDLPYLTEFAGGIAQTGIEVTG